MMTRSICSYRTRAAWVVFVALAAMLLALPLAVPAFAQSTIKVLVNDEPITSYDIQERGKMLRVFTGGKQGEKQAIDQLIEERLMMQEAKRRNVDVTEAELEGEIGNRARAAKLTGPQFVAGAASGRRRSSDLQGFSARQHGMAGGCAGALSSDHQGHRTGRHCSFDWTGAGGPGCGRADCLRVQASADHFHRAGRRRRWSRDRPPQRGERLSPGLSGLRPEPDAGSRHARASS